jgi:hypothetical protein
VKRLDLMNGVRIGNAGRFRFNYLEFDRENKVEMGMNRDVKRA